MSQKTGKSTVSAGGRGSSSRQEECPFMQEDTMDGHRTPIFAQQRLRYPPAMYHLQVGTAVLCSGEVERLYFGGEFVRCGNTSPSTKQLDEEWEGNT
jgi:hypothetical protein